MVSAASSSSSSSSPESFKTLILIRHGHSLGQQAKDDRKNRKKDESLTDAGLSNKGINQATNLPKTFDINPIDLIVVSPLTRALQTALLIFRRRDAATVPMIVQYNIREMGHGNIPENRPRRIETVLRDIESQTFIGGVTINWEGLDWVSLKPEDWPSDVEEEKQKRGKPARHLEDFKAWVNGRPEQTIACVCHKLVIASLLGGRSSMRITNCEPLYCKLFADGRLDVVE
jgi:broad specificity phosphatase PhoE